MAADHDVEQRLAALEQVVASLSEQVTTRRLVVQDEAGVGRVVLSAAHRTGSVLVRVSGPEGATTGIELVAAEPEDEAPVIGVAQLRSGDVVAVLDAELSGGRRRRW